MGICKWIREGTDELKDMVGFRCKSGREANSIHAVNTDCAQEMHAGTRGGFPVGADGERRGSTDWRQGMVGHFFY